MSPVRALPISLLILASLALPADAIGQDAGDAEPMTQEDYYGEYDLFFGTMPPDLEESGMIGRWTATEFVVLEGGNPTIRVEMAIDPAKGELRMWDSSTSDVLCATEGIYEFEDDGKTITLELVSDPCPGRAESADGARLVRRTTADN